MRMRDNMRLRVRATVQATERTSSVLLFRDARFRWLASTALPSCSWLVCMMYIDCTLSYRGSCCVSSRIGILGGGRSAIAFSFFCRCASRDTRRRARRGPTWPMPISATVSSRRVKPMATPWPMPCDRDLRDADGRCRCQSNAGVTTPTARTQDSSTDSRLMREMVKQRALSSEFT